MLANSSVSCLSETLSHSSKMLKSLICLSFYFLCQDCCINVRAAHLEFSESPISRPVVECGCFGCYTWVGMFDTFSHHSLICCSLMLKENTIRCALISQHFLHADVNPQWCTCGNEMLNPALTQVFRRCPQDSVVCLLR